MVNGLIFGHWVSQNCLPKITKRKLRGYCYLVIGQNFSKTIYLKGEHRKLRKRKLRGRKLRGHSTQTHYHELIERKNNELCIVAQRYYYRFDLCYRQGSFIKYVISNCRRFNF